MQKSIIERTLRGGADNSPLIQVPEAHHHDALRVVREKRARLRLSSSLTRFSLRGTRKNSQAILRHAELVSASINADVKGVGWVQANNQSSASKKVAFTLAEVLITLGIIGVVAALTLPTLIQNHKKTEIITRLKKFDSVMQQAILMAQNDFGEPSGWEKGNSNFLKDENGDNILNENGATIYDAVNGSKDVYEFVMKYFAPYIKYSKIEPYNETEKRVGLYFDDGSIAWIKNGSCADFKLDVNGNKNPNQDGFDRFTFVICPTTSKAYFGNQDVYWGASYLHITVRNDRERVREECIKNPEQCARLIQLDGWEFASDYPFKF